MELVAERVDKQVLLETKRQEQENVGCKIENFSIPEKTVDKTVSEKLAGMRKAEEEKGVTEATEEKKFRNAVTFTDIPATIEKAGFHPDGSPKVAVAGLFHEEVSFGVDGKQAKYCSKTLTSFKDDFSVVLSNIKIDWISYICFIIGFIASMASFVIGFEGLLTRQGESDITIALNCCAFVPTTFLFFVFFFCVARYDNPFTYLYLDKSIGRVKARSKFVTKVPLVPKHVLYNITGHGPFAILFEVTEGWKNITPDPVIFRIINIDGQQFFEPVVGYDMTPLEKASLVEA